MPRSKRCGTVEGVELIEGNGEGESYVGPLRGRARTRSLLLRPKRGGKLSEIKRAEADSKWHGLREHAVVSTTEIR